MHDKFYIMLMPLQHEVPPSNYIIHEHIQLQTLAYFVMDFGNG